MEPFTSIEKYSFILLLHYDSGDLMYGICIGDQSHTQHDIYISGQNVESDGFPLAGFIIAEQKAG